MKCPPKISVAEIVYSLDCGKFGGGAERFVLSLSSRLNAAKFEVMVCALWRVNTSSEERNLEELLSHGIETVILADWNDTKPVESFLASFRALWNFAAEHRINILHSHSQFGDIMLLFLKIFRRVNFVVRTVHDGYFIEWRKRPIRRMLFTNFLYPIFFDAEIGVNDHIVTRLNQRLIAKILKRRSLCIYNAIDVRKMKKIIREMGPKRDILRGLLGIKSGEFLVGTIGRLVSGKGFETFIQAVPEVLSLVPNARFLIIGDGPNSDSLRRLARQLRVEDYIIFAGTQLDIENMLRCMDLFVLPSFWEGLSTTVLESMAAGVPVVVSDIPGNAILVQDQINGWVIPPGNSHALARAIVSASQNPQLCHKFVDNSRRVIERFSIDRAVKEHEKLYMTLSYGTAAKHLMVERFSHKLYPHQEVDRASNAKL